jgi:hypothetical protein
MHAHASYAYLGGRDSIGERRQHQRIRARGHSYARTRTSSQHAQHVMSCLLVAAALAPVATVVRAWPVRLHHTRSQWDVEANTQKHARHTTHVRAVRATHRHVLATSRDRHHHVPTARVRDRRRASATAHARRHDQTTRARDLPMSAIAAPVRSSARQQISRAIDRAVATRPAPRVQARSRAADRSSS